MVEPSRKVALNSRYLLYGSNFLHISYKALRVNFPCLKLFALFSSRDIQVFGNLSYLEIFRFLGPCQITVSTLKTSHVGAVRAIPFKNVGEGWT